MRIHFYRACGAWSILSKLLVTVLVRTATRLLREPHAAARRLLAVFAGHEAVLLEATASAAAATTTVIRSSLHRKRFHKLIVFSEELLPSLYFGWI